VKPTREENVYTSSYSPEFGGPPSHRRVAADRRGSARAGCHRADVGKLGEGLARRARRRRASGLSGPAPCHGESAGAPDLLGRDFTASTSGTKLVSDITYLSKHSVSELVSVASALNSRPRKTLDWQTPAEVLNSHLMSMN